jgi:RNA polymerase-binding transcription factor DksA
MDLDPATVAMHQPDGATTLQADVDVDADRIDTSADADVDTSVDSGVDTGVDSGVDTSVVDRIEEDLADVERALARLDEGTYGRCEVCGDALSDAELEHAPATRFCRAHLPMALP